MSTQNPPTVHMSEPIGWGRPRNGNSHRELHSSTTTDALLCGIDGEAVEIYDRCSVWHVLPVDARNNCIAAYRTSLETGDVYPLELPTHAARRLSRTRETRGVMLSATPARHIDTGGIPVSWHARVRWAQRVAPCAEPATHIRRAFRRGIAVGVDRGGGRYYSPADAVVTYVGPDDDPTVVTTVLPAADTSEFRTDHLLRCEVCRQLFNPQNGPDCKWCGTTRRRIALPEP